MDQHQRFAQDQSLKNSTKGSRKSFLFLVLFLSACASKKPAVPQGLGSAGNTNAQKTLEISSTLGAKLTSEGESYSPSLSDNGIEILFLSDRPETHQQPQVYLYNLETLSERRVTYQDGQCSSPIFVKKGGDIVYASTTDEIKERPVLLQKSESNEIPSELYLSDINGSSIRRLTKHPGFDGEPVDRPDKGNLIYFSQQSQGANRILQLNLATTQSAFVLGKKGISIEDFRPSPSGKSWVWTERDMSSQKTSNWLAEKSFNKAQLLSLPKGQYQDYFWIDDGHLLLSAKLADSDDFQIASYDLEKKCLRSVISHKSNLTEPQLATNQKSLIFVSDANKTRQLYYRSIVLDWTSPCLGASQAPPAAKPPPPSTTTTTTTTTTQPSPSTTVPAAPTKN